MIILVLCIQTILYFLNKKFGGKIPYSLLWVLTVLTFIFVLPQFDKFPVNENPDDIQCGLPVIYSMFSFYIVGPFLSTLIHVLWMLMILIGKNKENKMNQL